MAANLLLIKLKNNSNNYNNSNNSSYKNLAKLLSKTIKKLNQKLVVNYYQKQAFLKQLLTLITLIKLLDRKLCIVILFNSPSLKLFMKIHSKLEN